MGTFAKKPAEAGSNWLGPVLGGLLLLVLLVFVLRYILKRPVPQSPPDIGQEVAELFLKQLREGAADLAWQSTTAEFKSDEGRESFARNVRQHFALWPVLEFREYRQGELNGLPRGQCIYHAAATANPAPIQQVRIAVAQEEGNWKVEGLFLDPTEPALLPVP
jgi:hypothetical protein